MTESPPLSISPVPKKIGKYPIEGIYAQGGMGILFLATEPETHDQIIVKVLLPKFLSDQTLVQQFVNEGKVIAMTDHPNIVKLFEYGEWEGGLFIAMELVKGISLRKTLQRNPLALKKALQVFLQACYATAHLHSHSVVHGDLKPENILITDQDQVKVIDFGIAKVLFEPGDAKEGKKARFAGTPVYMSPETQADPRKCSFQSDIYSLGIIAYELVMGKITHGKVIISLAPRGMQRILTKALQKDPAKRYHDINDFIHDIAEYIHSGELQKDRQGADYFFELFERVETKQEELLIKQTPDSLPHVGLTASYGVRLNALYYRCDAQPNTTTVIIAEGKQRDIEGIIDSYRLHTLFESRQQNDLPPVVRVAEIFQQAALQKLEFRYCCLSIDHMAETFSWNKNGWGQLFTASSHKTQQLSLPGVESQSLQGIYDDNDRFIIVGSTSPSFLEFSSSPMPPLDVVLTEAIDASLGFSPQKQTNVLLQKLRLHGDCILDDRPVCIVSLNPSCPPHRA